MQSCHSKLGAGDDVRAIDPTGVDFGNFNVIFADDSIPILLIGRSPVDLC